MTMFFCFAFFFLILHFFVFRWKKPESCLAVNLYCQPKQDLLSRHTDLCHNRTVCFLLPPSCPPSCYLHNLLTLFPCCSLTLNSNSHPPPSIHCINGQQALRPNSCSVKPRGCFPLFREWWGLLSLDNKTLLWEIRARRECIFIIVPFTAETQWSKTEYRSKTSGECSHG